MLFKEEAESCRRKAAAYMGQPEGPFLLRVARAFDELATCDVHPKQSVRKAVRSHARD